MKTLFSMFCEAVKITPDGLISMLQGGYTEIAVSSFPISVPHLYVLTRIYLESDECGQDYKGTMRAVGPKGNVISSDLELIIHVKPNEGRGNVFTASYDFSNSITLYEPGEYLFFSFVDGVKIDAITLIVKLGTTGA